MTRADTGLLLFIRDSARTAANWAEGEPQGVAAEELIRAAHLGLLATLKSCEGTSLYMAPAGSGDEAYVESLAADATLELLEVPMAPPLQRWDSGLSILYNRCAHRKILCADGTVPDIGVEDIARARRKLELYRMILGREAEDRCWLVGLNGYEEILGRADVREEDLLHPLLQVAAGAGMDVSLLDTKRSLSTGAQLETLRTLARRPAYQGLREALSRHRLERSPVAEEG